FKIIKQTVRSSKVTTFGRKRRPAVTIADMTFMIIRAEPSDWEAVRDIRLRSLLEEPDAYASEYQTEARFEPDLWKQRLATAAALTSKTSCSVLRR
ncbi:MAG: hypothetical protein ACRDPL_14070, partial [Propionibacteriaceae bacterium]